MKCYDDLSFENDEQEIEYIRDINKQFNIIDFYNKNYGTGLKKTNGTEKHSGLIVITPEQMIALYPVFLHNTASIFLKYLLYDVDNVEGQNTTNNIVIRLVSGNTYLFNISEFPKAINTFQHDKLQELINELSDYEHLINFDSQSGVLVFKETFDDAVSKLESVPVVNNLPNVIKDKYIITEENLEMGGI